MNLSISVIIPTYNRGALIDKTVQTVLSQDLPAEEVELIIIDDGSTDNTWEVLQSLYSENPQIRLFTIPNGGVANARNFGLKEARGEFVAYLDHDDLWLPDKLRLQRAKLIENTDSGVVYCDWLAVDENNKPLGHAFQVSHHYWWRPKQGNVFPWILVPHIFEFSRSPIISMTMPMMRTEMIREIGGFDAQIVPSDDWDLWIRLSKVTRFTYVPKVLAHYVFHDAQQHKDMEKASMSWLEINRKYVVSPLKHPIVWLKQQHFKLYCHAIFHYADAKQALFRGKYGAVIKLYLKNAIARPLTAFRKDWIYLLSRVLKRNSSEY